MKTMKKTYICANCHKEFESDWSDEKANKEAEELWGVSKSSQKPEEMAVVCDDCFNLLIPHENAK